MKVFLAFTFCALLALSGCFTGDSKKEERPKFALVGFDPSMPPMSWLEDGEPRGASIDTARTLLCSVPIDPRIRYDGAWDVVLERLKEGKLDFVVGIFRTDEREAYLDFSIPYCKIPVSVCVKSDASFTYTRWDDLKGRKGVIGIGQSYGEDFDCYAAEHLKIERLSIKDCFRALVEGRADYMIIEQQTGMIASWQYGLADDVQFMDIPLTTQNYHIAVSKKSPFRGDIPKINQRIISMNVEGTVERLVAKYLIMWKNRVILHTPAGLPPADAEL